MRVEVYGCLYEDGIVSYSAPPGDEFAPNFFIEDVYDGDEEIDEKLGPKLINGLGVLSDRFYGSNVTLQESGLSSGRIFFLYLYSDKYICTYKKYFIL